MRAQGSLVGLAKLLLELGDFLLCLGIARAVGSELLVLDSHLCRYAFQRRIVDRVVFLVRHGSYSFVVAVASLGAKYSLRRSKNDLRCGETSVCSSSARSRSSSSCRGVSFLGTSIYVWTCKSPAEPPRGSGMPRPRTRKTSPD